MSVHQDVQNYYGKELQKSEDLKTNACCTLEAPPKHIQKALSNVHDEVQAKYYGCGLTLAEKIKGLTILDLGSGSGRDCYIASQLVGESGQIIGVDMTEEQLNVANKYLDYHRDRFGYKESNVKFMKGNIEKLDELGLEPGSIDLVISNCVINLAMDKQKVLTDVYNLLREGGEMYFSDVYSDRRISAELQADKVLWGECLSGALYWNDFLTYSKKAGFMDARAVEQKSITVNNKELERKLGNIKFYSVTYRLFKIAGLESDCEDYGHAVSYKGTVDGNTRGFKLDEHHYFETGKVMPVCGNTYLMLNSTRFAEDFNFYGDFSTHYGIFEGCGGKAPFNLAEVSNASSASCC